jgi:hypothetical protein
VLLAAIRSKGICPCPRCLVPKVSIDQVGYLRDAQRRISNARTYVGDLVIRAREFIYKLGYGVTSAAVERLLHPRSLVPTLVSSYFVTEIFLLTSLQNTFGDKLGKFGFDPYVMLVVDLMHEFELGVWKAIFSHLIRLLHAAAPSGRLVAELDRRYVHNVLVAVLSELKYDYNVQVSSSSNIWS